MRDIKYNQYSKRKMLKIIQEDGILFVETNLGDNYIISKKDLADFIVLETIRTNQVAEISVYMPGIDDSVITTFGWFLNKSNKLLREEIIDRLVLLQTTNTKPKKIKIFNNDIFIALSPEEMGIENGYVKNFDKFYKKYVDAQNIKNNKREGV